MLPYAHRRGFYQKIFIDKIFYFLYNILGFTPDSKGIIKGSWSLPEKGVMCMEYIFIFLTVFCVLEIVKYIKK